MKFLSKWLIPVGMGIALGCATSAFAGSVTLSWKELPSTPANAKAWNDAIPVAEPFWRQIGLAGPITGVHGDYLLIGGGANFPEPGKMPNEGPTLGKVYWDELFVMNLAKEEWVKKSFTLPRSLAYAATLGLPEGVLVIGGEGFDGGPNGNAKAKMQKYANVFLMSFDPRKEEINFKEYPALPAPVSYATASLIGRVVYVQSGKDFLALDLDKTDAGWKALPMWPGEARDTALSATVGGKFILASGRTNKDGKWLIHKDAFAFNPKTASWSKLSDMPFPAMAGEGFAVANRYFVVIGGDKDIPRWDQQMRLETERKNAEKGSPVWEKANAALNFQFDHHVGFNSEILVFDTKNNTWSQAGFFPGSAPATTQPIVWKGKLIVAGGEIRPGVRTPKIWLGSPSK